jgi:hypothetical protein
LSMQMQFYSVGDRVCAGSGDYWLAGNGLTAIYSDDYSFSR